MLQGPLGPTIRPQTAGGSDIRWQQWCSQDLVCDHLLLWDGEVIAKHIAPQLSVSRMSPWAPLRSLDPASNHSTSTDTATFSSIPLHRLTMSITKVSLLPFDCGRSSNGHTSRAEPQSASQNDINWQVCHLSFSVFTTQFLLGLPCSSSWFREMRRWR